MNIDAELDKLEADAANVADLPSAVEPTQQATVIGAEIKRSGTQAQKDRLLKIVNDILDRALAPSRKLARRRA